VPKVCKERLVNLLKNTYDTHFAYEDKCDQAGAEVSARFRSKNWERSGVVGVMNLLVASNAPILMKEEHPDMKMPTTQESVQDAAYELAGYNPMADHVLVERTRGNCAPCMWWKKRRGDVDYKVRKATTACAYCQARVCSDCWDYRHLVWTVTLRK